MKLIEPDELRNFHDVLRRAGLPASDFRLNECDLTDPKTDEILALAGVVRIARKSTGKTAEYPTGDGSHWVGEFERDLRKKTFG